VSKYQREDVVEAIIAAMSHDKALQAAVQEACTRAENLVNAHLKQLNEPAVKLTAKERGYFVLGLRTPEAAGDFGSHGLMHVCLSVACKTVSITQAKVSKTLITV